MGNSAGRSEDDAIADEQERRTTELEHQHLDSKTLTPLHEKLTEGSFTTDGTPLDDDACMAEYTAAKELEEQIKVVREFEIISFDNNCCCGRDYIISYDDTERYKAEVTQLGKLRNAVDLLLVSQLDRLRHITPAKRKVIASNKKKSRQKELLARHTTKA